MAKNLLIVESPAKAKTIEKILGKDFQVKSCFGHIRDLEKDDMGIDIDHGFEPRYVVSEDKIKVVNELKKLSKSSEEVWLASDEDREGESISWHLCEVLGLDPASTKRIVFNEITKPAIQKAVQKPRTVNMNLVNAQQARRVLDRIVGFEISPVLWRKVGMQRSLSAGRVQSVAVRLIVEREREILHFQPQSSFQVKAFFDTESKGRQVSFSAEGQRLNDEAGARAFLESCKGAGYKVTDLQVKPGKRSPAPPFTTSTLQQEASRKLGYSVSRTMQLAQKLYEAGHITYMRTDSVNLSETARTDIEQTILRQFGNSYYQSRRYKNKNESAQEAHEAIRPTYSANTMVDEPDCQRLYDLIWKRTIASQMADAQLEKTEATIAISTNNGRLLATGEVIRFEGFLKVYTEGHDEEDEREEGKLPELTIGQSLDLKQMTATEKFTRPAARYTEASLVKKLEELGIGRPSTYAPTISTIEKRNYVEKKDKDGVPRSYHLLTLKQDEITATKPSEQVGAEKAKLFPTDLGFVVTDFLTAHFGDVMDYHFTAGIEEEFDKIAEGKKAWNQMIREFYGPFHHDVAETLEKADRATGERFLGEEPESRRPVIARMGRYGAMIQIGSSEDEEKPRFASLKPGQSIESITLTEALELFKMPFSLGDYNGQEMTVNIGRYGPYVKHGDLFASLPKGVDPLALTREDAVQLLEAKAREDAPVAVYQGQPVTKGKGRFGPFIRWGDLFVNVPRKYNFDHLSQADCEELIAGKLEKESTRYIQQWPELRISIENGRWGPYIRFGKKMLKLGREGKSKFTQEEAAQVTLEDVKRMVESQVPGAFDSKKAAASAKKAPAKKSAAKKSTARKASK